MSFDFSDLVIHEDGTNENFDYSQFLTDPIYDWLNRPEEILQVCDDLEKENNKKRKVTIIQQAQPQQTGYYKKVSYRRGPYKKGKKKDDQNCM
jgi:hypothetical protein